MKRSDHSYNIHGFFQDSPEMKRFLKFLWRVVVGLVQAPFVVFWIVLHVGVYAVVAIIFTPCLPFLLIEIITKDPIRWIVRKTGFKL